MASFRKCFLVSALFLAGAFLAVGRLAAADKPEVPQLSDDTNDAIAKELRPANDAKDWDKALGIIARVLGKVATDSYDAAVMNQIKAQVAFQKNDYNAALEAIEGCLAINDKKHFFDAKTSNEMLYQASQLNYQAGAMSKDTKKQAVFFAKAEAELQRWLAEADPKTFTQDTYLYVATMFYSRAQSEGTITDPKILAENRALLEKALVWIDKGLHMAIRPRDNLFQLKLATLFQLERFVDGADLLESMAKQKPEKKDYWQQLASTYLQLANAAEEKKESRTNFTYNIRAILTIERSQKYGFMSTPKDRYNLVGLYFGIGQFAKACDLLDSGLYNGTIESTQQNWELLAYSYQQIHEDAKAIATMKEAVKVFPKSGDVEYKLALFYSAMDKPMDALDHVRKCIEKGGTEKPLAAWDFYVFLAFDQKLYDEALKAAQQLAKLPEGKEKAAKLIDAINGEKANAEARRQSL